MALTRNTTIIAKQTTGDSKIFVTGGSTNPNSVVKWDSNGNAISSGFEMTNESFGGSFPSSSTRVPTQESVNTLINSRLGTIDGSQLGEIKINPENNLPSGGGGLSISSKVDGEQIITYTPPEFLTADQIDNTDYDNGEFAEFNADGNLVTSNLKKSLVINAASNDASLPTSKTVYTYGQNISADRLLGIDNTIGHGDFLSYNSATGGFEASTASVTSHKLFSATHTDVATNAVPSYGDSIYYDGNEWTTGNFGNWGADMEYRGIAGQNGATFSDLDYSGMNSEVRNMFNANGLRDAFSRPTPSTAPSTATNLSGNLSGLSLTSISNDDGNPIIFDDLAYTISGKVQFPINGFSGAGLVNSKIRGLYIRSQIFIAATEREREAEMYVTYPDGSKQPLLRSDKERYYEGGAVQTNIEEIIFVPVNEGQTQVEIEFNLDKSSAEGFGFEIIGALCTKRIELSPEVDHIQLVGSQELVNATDTSLDGYIDVNSVSLNSGTASERADIWSTQTPTTAPSNNWSDVLPITIPDNVAKTVIKSKSAWALVSPSEEQSTTEIIIDWNEQTITGTYFSDNEFSQSGYLYSDNLTGVKTFTIEDSGSFQPIIKIEISGRDIIKLPVPQHRNTTSANQPYQNYGLSYNIENYKTIASTAKRLGTGFTTLATDQLATVAAPISGTVEFDGYLIVTANFNSANEDDFAVDIGGTVFENNNYGVAGYQMHETVTLPIAAGETYSITSNEGTTFNVRFKAKTLEASGENGADGAPGATGPQGPTGADSTVPGPKGDTGDTGPQGPAGPRGAKGNTGSQGARGDRGIKGDVGSQGERGLQGVKGNTGATGPQGPTGSKGIQGIQGPTGAVGPTGDFSDASLTGNGYQKLPNGLIMQWGTTAAGTNNTGNPATTGKLVNFPIPFPNSCLNLVTGMVNATANNPNYMTHARQITKSNFRMVYDSTENSASGTIQGSWQAFGH